MYHHLLLIVVLFAAVLSGGCAAGKTGTAGKAKVRKDSFYVIFDKKFKREDARSASVTGELSGKKHFFTLSDKQEFNLAKLCGTYTPIKDAAIVSFEITAPADGVYTLGLGADFWYTCYLNGKLVGTTEPKGEPAEIPSYLNSHWQVRLKKGANRFFAHTRPGIGSWNFSCGLLPDLNNWPESHAARLTLFQRAFPQKEKMLGPFVTHVSTDKAFISFEYSKNIAASLRYWIDGKKGKSHELSDLPLYGMVPRKKIHRFELKGLQSGKKYHFEIFDRERIPGKLSSGSFTTLPDQGISHVMTAISDTQVADLPREELIRSLVRKGIFKNTDLLVSLGDVTSTFFHFNNHYFESFLIPFKQEGVTVPFYPVRGNHEYRGHDTDKFIRYFGCPYYAFRYGKVLYIVLDTGEDKPRLLKDGHYTLLTDTRKHFQEQKKWLQQLIQSDMCKTAEKRIVLAHATPFEWESQYYAQNIASFASVFYGKNPECSIDLWLCGDIHSPYRFDPVTKKLSGAVRKPSVKRPCRLTENDLKNIHFPVYVNDGPRGAGKNFSVTRIEVKKDGLLLTCTGDDGVVMDQIVIRKGKPIEVRQSIYKKYIPMKK